MDHGPEKINGFSSRPALDLHLYTSHGRSFAFDLTTQEGKNLLAEWMKRMGVKSINHGSDLLDHVIPTELCRDCGRHNPYGFRHACHVNREQPPS